MLELILRASLWSTCSPVCPFTGTAHTLSSQTGCQWCVTPVVRIFSSLPHVLQQAVLLFPDVSVGMLMLMTCKHVLKSLRKMQVLLSQITMTNNSTRISDAVSTKNRVMYIASFFLFRNLQAQVLQTQKQAKSVVAWKPNTDGWNMDWCSQRSGTLTTRWELRSLLKTR